MKTETKPDLIGEVRHLPERSQRAVYDLLVRFADRAAASSAQMFDGLNNEQKAAAKPQADYWRNVCSGMKWAAVLVQQATGLTVEDAETASGKRPGTGRQSGRKRLRKTA